MTCPTTQQITNKKRHRKSDHFQIERIIMDHLLTPFRTMEIKSFNCIYPTKYVIRKSQKKLKGWPARLSKSNPTSPWLASDWHL